MPETSPAEHFIAKAQPDLTARCGLINVRLIILCLLAVAIGLMAISLFPGSSDPNSETTTRFIPPPLPDKLPYAVVGTVEGVRSGDYFNFDSNSRLHFMTLQGVVAPKPGQPFYKTSRAQLKQLVDDQSMRAVVKDSNESRIETVTLYWTGSSHTEAQVPVDIGLEMLKLGMAWYDGGTGFDNSGIYRQTFEQARRAKIGLWQQDQPQPPWEFESVAIKPTSQ